MRSFKISLLLSLLLTFSLTACSPEIERQQNDDKDTSHHEEVDASNTDIGDGNNTDIEEDTSIQDAQSDIEEDTSTQDVEQDVEQDIEEADVPEVEIPRESCTITEDTDEITVSCPDGTRATFIANLAQKTSVYCNRLAGNDDEPETIECNTANIVDDVIISDTGAVYITSPMDIAYLAYVTTSNRELRITAPGLTSFTFQSLKTVHNFYIAGNDNLTNPSFPELDRVTRGLYIERNKLITSLNGLNKITSISGSLDIKHNPLLTNLEGLDLLVSVGGNVVILNNIELISPTGLNELRTINGYLLIQQNHKLVNLDGLENLELLGKTFTITGNPALCQNIIQAWLTTFQTATGWDDVFNITNNKTCN